MEPHRAETAGRDPVFESKIRKARLALVAEQLWLRLWLLFALAVAFLLVSFTGTWALLDPWAHKALLGVFALAAVACLVHAARLEWPSRDDAIRRIERVSGIPHRPATSYEDTLTAQSSDPATQAIWSAHKSRMAALIARLRPGHPEPRTHRFDPFGLRALAVLGLVIGLGFTGRQGIEQLKSAFRFQTGAEVAEARLDAWATPPAYTGRAPIMLADGASPEAQAEALAASADAKPIEVPEKSSIIVRTSGTSRIPLALEIWTPGAKEPVRVEPDPKAAPAAGVTEVRTEMTASATLKVVSGSDVLAQWPLTVIPDNIPGIALTKNPERTERGAIKLTYFVQDDYGVASAAVKFSRAKDKGGNDKTKWARPELKGPRPPFTRPPELTLRLPSANAKQGEAFTYHEIGSHPWAGQTVMMTLEAKDVAGKTGRSQPMKIVLPERAFTKPLARALIEQRKLLIEDPRYGDQVMTALSSLTLEPEGFIDDPRVYLPLRAVFHRLGRERTRATIDSAVEQLWHTALRIEDGDLSDAEKNLRDIQERLAKALEDGASDEEIAKLMQEMREAFNEYAKQLAKENEGQDQQNADGQDQQNEQMSSEDLEQMMRQMEDMAKSGMREQAKEMLAEMRDMMERMQKGQQNQQQARENREMQQAIKKMGEVAGEQQDLMDETFSQKQQGNNPQKGGKNTGERTGSNLRTGRAGQQGQQRGEQQDDGPSSGNPLGGQEQGQGSPGQGNSGGNKLADRQKALREKLAQLRKEMSEKGLEPSERLDDAGQSMQSAEEALGQGDLDEANQQQGRALDQLRESAEQMAQQMQQNSPQRYGQNGDTPRDPMGRPQRSQGPDQGRSVKVPDQIDMQRAREVLEELRRRLGEAKRPQIELDYLERLLKWN